MSPTRIFFVISTLYIYVQHFLHICFCFYKVSFFPYCYFDFCCYSYFVVILIWFEWFLVTIIAIIVVLMIAIVFGIVFCF